VIMNCRPQFLHLWCCLRLAVLPFFLIFVEEHFGQEIPSQHITLAINMQSPGQSKDDCLNIDAFNFTLFHGG